MYPDTSSPCTLRPVPCPRDGTGFDPEVLQGLRRCRVTALTSEELQTAALAALEGADVAALKRIVIKMLPMAERDIERRAKAAGRKRKSRDVTGHPEKGVTSAPPPAPPFPPLLPPTPPNNPSLPSPPPETADTRHAAHENRFADPDHLLAYQHFRSTGGVAVDGGLRAVTQGMTGNRTVYGWPVVGAALAEMHANGAKFSVEGCRAYCRKLVTPERVSAARGTNGREARTMAAVNEFLNGGTNGES